MGSTAVEAILLRLGLDATGFTKGTREARKEMGAFEKGVGSLKSEISSLAAGIAAGVGLGALVHEALEFAESVTKVAAQTGLAVESVQFLRLAADQTGTSVDSLAGYVNKMQRQLVEASSGNEKVAQGFADMGVQVDALRAMAPEEQLLSIARAIAEIHDPAERAAAAVAAFGRSGADALPELIELAQKQDELNEAFARTGGAVSDDAIAKVEGLGDAIGQSKTAVVALATELLSTLAPAFTAFFETVTEIVGGLRLLDGEGDNALVNLDNKITDAKETLQVMEQQAYMSFGGMTSVTKDAIEQQKALIKSLEDEYAARTQLGTAGVQAAKNDLEFRKQLKVAGDEATASLLASLENEVAWREEFGNVVFEGELTRQQQFEKMRQEASDRYFKRLEEDSKKEVAIRKITQEEITAVLDESVANQQSVQKVFWDDQITSALGSLEQMTAGVARHSRAMFELNKAASIANAIVNTSQGVTKALAQYPPPLSFAMAAAQAAAGVAQIQAIASTQFGSKTAPSQAAQPVTPTAPVGGAAGGAAGGAPTSTLRVEGVGPESLLTYKMVRNLAERLTEHVKDGGRVEFA